MNGVSIALAIYFRLLNKNKMKRLNGVKLSPGILTPDEWQ